MDAAHRHQGGGGTEHVQEDGSLAHPRTQALAFPERAQRRRAYGLAELPERPFRRSVGAGRHPAAREGALDHGGQHRGLVRLYELSCAIEERGVGLLHEDLDRAAAGQADRPGGLVRHSEVQQLRGGRAQDLARGLDHRGLDAAPADGALDPAVGPHHHA